MKSDFNSDTKSVITPVDAAENQILILALSGSRMPNQPGMANSEYEDTLKQAIAKNEELRQEMQKLISSWQTERSQLKTRIVQLEHSLVDAIERSNNPLRTKLISEEKIRLVEEVKREWNAQWDAERKHLLAELKKAVTR